MFKLNRNEVHAAIQNILDPEVPEGQRALLRVCLEDILAASLMMQCDGAVEVSTAEARVEARHTLSLLASPETEDARKLAIALWIEEAACSMNEVFESAVEPVAVPYHLEASLSSSYESMESGIH